MLNISHPLRLKPDLLKQRLDASYPAFGVGITFQVMAVAGQSTGDKHAVNAFLEGVQHHQHVDPAGAGQLHDS